MIKILLAHNNEKLVELYHPHLSRHFSVDSANDGLTALRKLKLIRPEAIIASYELPFLSGLALLKYVRNEPLFSPMPFIFLSDSPNTHEGLSFGASDWIDSRVSSPDILIDKIFKQIKYGIQIHRT